jgi:hypothetical protein
MCCNFMAEEAENVNGKIFSFQRWKNDEEKVIVPRTIMIKRPICLIYYEPFCFYQGKSVLLFASGSFGNSRAILIRFNSLSL